MVDILPAIRTAGNDSRKPSDFLNQVNDFFQSKLMTQVQALEEMMDAHMAEFIVKNGDSSDADSVSFHIELSGNSFKLMPHNFFTYLLSEGIYVPLRILGDSFAYRTEAGLYKFEKDSNDCPYGCFIPIKNLDLIDIEV